MELLHVRSSILAAVLLVAVAAGHEAAAQRPGTDPWRPKVDKVDEQLRAGKWKSGQRKARRLAAEICAEGWYGRELKETLAELAFYQAAAAANLGERDAAAWYWHTAQNVDRRIRERDLAPYGEAGKLLRELRLRRPGTAPPPFRLAEPDYGKYRRARLTEAWAPVLSHNPGAAAERPGDLYVELIVDREGAVHHPVVLTGGANPVLVYGTLEALRAMPRLEPARYGGEPVDSLFKYTLTPDFSRWHKGGKTFTGEIQ